MRLTLSIAALFGYEIWDREIQAVNTFARDLYDRDPPTNSVRFAGMKVSANTGSPVAWFGATRGRSPVVQEVLRMLPPAEGAASFQMDSWSAAAPRSL
jgi:hypothetical protein